MSTRAKSVTAEARICDDDSRLRILQTPRLILRRIKPSDIEALVALWTNPQVTAWMGGPRDKSALPTLFAEAAVDPFADDFDLWPVVEKASNCFVGHCGLVEKTIEDQPEIEMIYVFQPEAWGRGYATEMAEALCDHAFRVLRLSRVVALIAPGNGASERVAAKIGMTHTRDVLRPRGVMRNLYVLDNPWGADRRRPGR